LLDSPIIPRLRPLEFQAQRPAGLLDHASSASWHSSYRVRFGNMEAL
jgi:hypothetical protein